MALEEAIYNVQLARDHPTRVITITLCENIKGHNSNAFSLEGEQHLRVLVEDLHTLYRLVTRKRTGPRGIMLPAEARPKDCTPHWVYQGEYCYSFIDREGRRYAEVALAEDNRTLTISNSLPEGAIEMELLYETLMHYVPYFAEK